MPFTLPHPAGTAPPLASTPTQASPSSIAAGTGPLFANRRDAGRQLGQALHRYAAHPDVLVLALPRGGVPVGHEVAQALSASLDVCVVRKLGLPGQPEFAMGAIATGEWRVLNTRVIEGLGIDESALDLVTRAETRELHRRERLYRGDRPPPPVAGRRVIVVDDGLATGATMRAAVLALRQGGPAEVLVAVPVGAEDICALLRQDADEVLCLHNPEPLHAVGRWYERFDQVGDDEVRALLVA